VPTVPITNYAFVELNEGSGRGIIAEDGQPSEAHRCFKIAWADLPNFLFALRGGWRSVNSSTWTFYTPATHPLWITMYCVSAEFEGFGLTSYTAGTDLSAWEYAKVTACYKTPSANWGAVDPTQIIEETFDFGLDIIRLPKGTVETTTGKLLDDDVALPVPTIQYCVRMPNLPNLPGGSIAIIMGLLGNMNSGVFGGAAVGKMLFLGMQASRKGILSIQPPTGTNALDSGRPWDVTLKFSYRDRMKWDQQYVPGETGPVSLRFKSGGAALVTSGNLNLLLPNGV
jgi:hypothetical protein